MIWMEILFAGVLVIMMIMVGSVNIETRRMLVAMQAYKAQAERLEREAKNFYLSKNMKNEKKT